MSCSSSHSQIQRFSTRSPHGSTTTEEKIRWSLGKLTVTDETIQRNKLVTDHMGRNIGHKQEVVKKRTEVVKYESGEKDRSHHHHQHQHQHPREVVEYASREKHKSHDYYRHQTREVVKYESREKGKSHQHQQHHQARDVVEYESREKYKSRDYQHHHHQPRELLKYESREKQNNHQHQHQSREVVTEYESTLKYHPSVSIPIPWW